MKTIDWLRIATATLILVSTACSFPAPTGIGIESIDWVIFNRATSFVSDSTGGTAVIQFSIKFETPGPAVSDIASVYIGSLIGNIGWSFKDPSKFSETYNAKEYVLTLLITGSKIDVHVMPIGTYYFTVTYSNDAVVKYSFQVPAPGALEAGSTSYVYTEDYFDAWNPPSNYAALPRRATSISAVHNSLASELTIKFSVNDDKIYNSNVGFFDSSKNHIGAIDWLRDYSTDVVSSTLNNGQLHSDGTENTLILSKSDIQFIENKGMSDIHSLLIFLADGLQYPLGNRASNTMSLSEAVFVTTN